MGERTGIEQTAKLPGRKSCGFFSLTMMGKWLLVACLLFFLILPGLEQPHRHALPCIKLGRQLREGLYNYAYMHQNHLPPAFIRNEQGEPVLSWRVEVLSAMRVLPQGTVIDRQLSWRDPVHQTLATQNVQNWLGCPATQTNRPHETSWFVITGEQTPFPARGLVSFEEISAADGLSQTLLMTEAEAMSTPWMQPRDIPFSALDQPPKKLIGRGPSSAHTGGAVTVLYADGHVGTLSGQMSPRFLRALATWQGEEAMPEHF